MRPWTFHSAVSLIFGNDSIQQLGAVSLQLQSKRVFIVTDGVLEKTGVVQRVVEPLRNAGLEIELFLGGQPEPAVEIVRSALEQAKPFRADAVLGLGGGSNMDTAKLVSLCLQHGGDPTQYVGDCQVPGPVKTLICVPTTAGTGSEVSAAAVFTDTSKKMKVSCLSNYLRPAAAIVDPLLTLSCPAKVTADSGIDALTHAIEAFTAVDNEEFGKRPPSGPSVYQGKNPMADAMALECISLVGRFLRRAVRDGQDREAREGMALAATLGGLAFSNSGVALVHAMEYPVGGAVHVSHGAGNGLLLPYVMRYNLPERKAAFETIGKHLAADVQSPGDWAERAISAVEQLRIDTGIPTRLRDIAVKQEMLTGFAEKAFSIKRLMRTNPRFPTQDEILNIYQAAF